KPRHAAVLNEESEPRPCARLARAVVAKDERDLFAQLGCFGGFDKYVEIRGRRIPPRTLLAPRERIESSHLPSVDLLDRRHQADVLRFGMAAVVQAARDRDVELSRQ